MDIKERNWLLALISAVAAITYPIGTLLVAETSSPAYAAGNVEEFLGMTGSYYFLFLLAAAMLAGVSGFMYLERQDKADFFMSFPVKREIFFFVPYLSGWLISVVPYVLFMLLAIFPVCGIKGCLTGALVRASFRAMGFNILSFTAIYSVVVLAMVLTGRMLIGVLLSMCFLFYGSCASILLNLLKDMFFDTWYGMGSEAAFLRYSPVTAMGYFADSPAKAIFLEILWLLPALAAAVLIYVKRPAETAENAFTFSWMAPVLKTVISIPIGIAGGMLLRVFADNAGRNAWFLFGSVLIAFITNGVIEFVIAPDLKNIARHWISGTVILAGTLGAASIFAFDLTGFDRWYPDKNDIQAMAISEDFVTEGFGEFGSVNSYYQNASSYLTEMSGEQIYLNRNLVENFDGLYEIAGIGVRASLDRSKVVYGRQTTMLYKMKSGRLVYRTYLLPLEAIDEAVRETASETEFRKLYYPFGQFKPERFNFLSAQDWNKPGVSYDGVDLTEAESRELFAALEADSLKMNLADAFRADPVLVIYPSYAYDTWEDYRKMHAEFSLGDNLDCIYVYENYEKTLAWLEDKIIRDENRREGKVRGAWCWISNYSDSNSPAVQRILQAVQEAGNTAYFTDEESIRKLLSSVKRVGGSATKTSTEVEINISFELASGTQDFYTEEWGCKIVDEETLLDLFMNHNETNPAKG